MITKSLVSVASGNTSKKTPIWFMRQAGRYLPEYRQVRKEQSDFIQFILNSDAAAEVTMQPLQRFDLNAAIIFSDILIVPYAMGIDVKFIEGVGPIISPIAKEINISDKQQKVFSKVNKAISLVSYEINQSKRDVALIGFAGAPWTIMCYIVEGSISKHFQKVRSFYLTSPDLWDKIVQQIVDSTIQYLCGQIDSGAEIVKLFDSWAGAVPYRDFEKLVIAPTRQITSALKKKYPHIPIIGFPRCAGVMYKDYVERSGVDVVAIDSNISPMWARDNLQSIVGVQGNMDNMMLAYSSYDEMDASVKEIMDCFYGSRFIFNLGHGILPETRAERIIHIIDKIRQYET